ncbi:MAG: hypothetical protein QXU45_07620 [Candidatus Bathyarchaeia archaeon]
MKILIFSSMITMAFVLVILYGLIPITWETAQTLFTYNLLFLLILLPLKGSWTRKMAIHLLGNILSFIWSTLFYLSAHSIAGQVDGMFNALYVILSPLLNVLWVVAFWSTSLTFLAEKEEGKRWKAW